MTQAEMIEDVPQPGRKRVAYGRAARDTLTPPDLAELRVQEPDEQALAFPKLLVAPPTVNTETMPPVAGHLALADDERVDVTSAARARHVVRRVPVAVARGLLLVTPNLTAYAA